MQQGAEAMAREVGQAAMKVAELDAEKVEQVTGAEERLAAVQAEAERTGDGFNAVAFALASAGEDFELEIGRAFERRISDGSMWLEMIIRELDLSAEQERMVRGMALDYFEEVGLDPTQAEQEAFFLKLVTRLRPDQAADLFALVNHFLYDPVTFSQDASKGFR